MKVYSDSEAEKNLNSVLREASKEGAAGIRKKDGQTFIVRPENVPDSPLNVEGVKLPISTDEIVGFIHEARKER
ncbi:MAG: hypothetical protein ABSE63_01845 [Thermoguttaceae bacterium]|jgi:hypothetical protein